MDIRKTVREIIIFIAFVAVTFFSLNGSALVFQLPPQRDDLIGHVQIVLSKSGDTLYKLSRKYEMGYDELVQANLEIRQYGRLRKNTGVIIPAYFILPDAPRNGIIINLPEKRLYYYPVGRHMVLTEPVAIGEYGWPTPLMIGYVIEKIKDPEWRVPESIQIEQIAKGEEPKTVVPPGPDNPLGQYALRLSAWSLLIHGTNAVYTIGKRASHGCIRMYPEDIEELFYNVPENTPIRIVDQPYKVGWKDNKLYLEVHTSLIETRGTVDERVKKVYELIMVAVNNDKNAIDWNAVKEALIRQTGLPQLISKPGYHRSGVVGPEIRVLSPMLYYQ